MNLRPETLKLLEENTGSKPLDISIGDDFLALTPKGKATKLKIKKWEHIKLESSLTAKEAINKMARQPTQWEKILANHTSDKELIFKINEELIQLNSKNPKQSD